MPSYEEWLVQMIRLREHIYFDYQFIRSLRRSFKIVLEQDVNRAMDGLELREEYEDLYGVPAPEGNCSVLEVLIALAKRIAFITGDSFNEEETISHWFWTMIKNLELSNNEELNRHILTIWMERRFKFNGKGSPFPLQKCDENQKKVEIWYQMQAYLNENFEII